MNYAKFKVSQTQEHSVTYIYIHNIAVVLPKGKRPSDFSELPELTCAHVLLVYVKQATPTNIWHPVKGQIMQKAFSA